VHGLYHHRGKGQGHVADAHTDKLVIRVLFGELVDLLCDGYEQVALL
jgi:hypothetical protein